VEGVITARLESLADRRDRAFASRIEKGERTPRGPIAARSLDRNAERIKSLARAGAMRVLSKSRKELRAAGETRQLDRRNGTASGRLLKAVGGVDDLAGTRDVVDVGEFDPFEMSDDGCAHGPGFSPVGRVLAA
jgi:hypothetical protein